MAIMGPNAPLRIGQEQVWKGRDKTNGFLMRNADGRIPALKESFSRVDIGGGSVYSAAGATPYGNGLWRDLPNFADEPGVVKAEKPEKGVFVGVIEFNQGWQTGHPVQGWGIPAYGRSDMIRKGLVGYKVAMAGIGSDASYLSYLKGDKTADNVGVRTTYKDWVQALSEADDGAKLGLFFSHVSGSPIISVVEPEAQTASYAGTTAQVVVSITNTADNDISITADTYILGDLSCTVATAITVGAGESASLVFIASDVGVVSGLPIIGAAPTIADLDADLDVTVTSATNGTAAVTSAPTGVLTYSPGLVGATFAGYVEVFEPENEAVFVAIGG